MKKFALFILCLICIVDLFQLSFSMSCNMHEMQGCKMRCYPKKMQYCQVMPMMSPPQSKSYRTECKCGFK